MILTWFLANSMIRISRMNLLIILFFSLLANPCFSQGRPNTILWKLSKPGNPNISYLFGTFHEVNPDFFDSIKIANNYLQKSKVLVVESYVQQSDTAKLKSQNDNLTSYLSSWNKPKWDTLLTLPQREKFDSYVKSMYGSEDMYGYSPQALAFVLLRSYLQGIVDTLNRNSMELLDSRIIDIGLKNKLNVIGLEGDQIEVLKAINTDAGTLSDSNSVGMVTDLMNYIVSGNSNTDVSKALYDYKKFAVDYNFDSNLTNDLLDERNNNWMKSLPSLLENNSCFIAVGISHLGRKTGLIKQLRRLGYLVTPIRM